MKTIEERLEALEQHSHEPYDFTHLVERLEALETSVAEYQKQLGGLQRALEPFIAPKLPSNRRTVLEYNEWGLRCLMSPMEIAVLNGRRAFSTLNKGSDNA